jgi:very-short-patch-repair endonuclease
MTVFRPRETKKAQQLRNAATPAERRLWAHLGSRRLNGHKFSRQMPVGTYVADFLCRELRLIVEIDGYSHDLRMEHDAARTRCLKEEGFTVIRFTNADVFERVEGVLLQISEVLERLQPHPQPLPQAGGEQ